MWSVAMDSDNHNDATTVVAAVEPSPVPVFIRGWRDSMKLVIDALGPCAHSC